MLSDKVRYFFPKVKNRVLYEKNRIWKYCNVNRVSLLGYKPFSNSIAFKESLREMLGFYNPDILVGISDQDRNTILSCADQTLKHEFDYLGSGPVRLDPIDWHIDFKSGARWGKRFYRDINYIKNADIKVPWELSRCQHLLWLGEAFLLTDEKKYAKEIVEEINWWIDDNPFMYSVNWKCSMDVAFRAVNWIYALNMIYGYEGLDDSFTEKVGRSLWQHAFFIKNNLEKQVPNSNNHYASDIVGLLFLGQLFNRTEKGKRWLKFAIQEYFIEVRNQVFNSGIHYEKSVSYHRLMTEMFSYSFYLLQRNGVIIPYDVEDRIRKMYSYVSSYTKPNEFAPIIGDNDDGRFSPFLKRDFRVHNYLNNASSVENLFAALGRLPLSYETKQNNLYDKEAGIAIIRNKDSYLYINHAGYSMRPEEKLSIIGSHTHNDLLSFELNVFGCDIIVDAGSYLYTSSIMRRNEFRSTSKHNTVTVDEEEQNGFPATFALKKNNNKGDLNQITNDIFEGKYKTETCQMYHKRRFHLSNNYLSLKDSVNKKGDGHTLRIFFHFAEGLVPIVDKEKMLKCGGITFTFNREPVKIEIVEDTLSPSYGILVNSKTAIVEYNFDNELTIETIVKW